MIKIRELVKVESLEEAWELNQKRTNKILGGMLWLRLGNRNVQKAIDLSGLGLDQIEETEEAFSIGCMATLRQIELHEGLNALCEGLLHDAVCDIVGTQFRNLATVGGSIFGRFGFSDVMTAFLALDSYVELYKGGIVPMSEFVKMKRDRHSGAGHCKEMSGSFCVSVPPEHTDRFSGADRGRIRLRRRKEGRDRRKTGYREAV